MSKSEILENKYNPKEFEKNIYDNWEEKGYFKPNMDKEKEPYCIMMPPPNVTGKLHMGHALDSTIQDILIRFKRMQGYNTLWLPGSDHAAISTEMKVVEKLRNEGKSKQELGRDKFLEEAWEWTKLYGGTIEEQQKKLGCSCDWERRRFTLDKGLSDAVLEQFVSLYNEGLIYKGTRMINYCPNCKTSISDVEIEYKEEETKLWHIKYKIKDENRYLIVATTRPETMLGDTAVAVAPDDERYSDLIGKTCILPIMNKEIPIIADEFVEKEFGTGAVKVTPAHDMNDYQSGLRHNLEIIQVFDENNKMGNLVPKYEGMNLLEARKAIVKDLKEIGALVKEEKYIHNVAKCERCKNTVEPKISEQWFVSMKDLAKRAADSVRNEEAKFIPKKYEKNYFNWLDNIQDWCISRQLWWGHRIPAYYCEDCKHINVSKIEPEKCEKCGSTNLHQDEDTLDTWFSSALWPFSTLGWPNEEQEDYKTFYPTNVLVTGFDIITFWVSRMMSQGLKLTGKAPFKDILIHGMVRDSQGRKMSKTLGNGIDPIEIIDKYGADALRFSVISGTTMGNDIRYIPEKLEAASNFANKVWNASKFVLMNLEDYEKPDNLNLCIEDKWILSKLNKLVQDITTNIESYNLGVSLDKTYEFIWNEFCDWYIEIVKTRLYDKENKTRQTAQYVLNKVLGDLLKLLHPFMPFITEKIYTNLYDVDESIMISKFPEYTENMVFEEEEAFIEELKEVITKIRNIRAEMNVHPSKKASLIIVTKKYQKSIEASKEFWKKLGFAEEISVREKKESIPENAVNVLTSNMEIFIPFEELVDIKEEKERLEKEKSKILAEKLKVDGMANNPGFISKAPKAKVEEIQARARELEENLKNIEQRIESLNK